MKNQVDRFGTTLKKLSSVIGMAFGAAAIVNFGKEAVKAASALSDAWMGLESIVDGQGKSFSRAKSFINDYISDGLVPLENAVTAYKNLAARGYSEGQIEKTLTALKDAAAFGRQASYSLGDAVSTATEGLKNENSILVDNAGVTKNVAKMWDDYAKSIGTTSNKLTQAQKIQAEVNGIMEETRFQTGDAAKLVNTYSGQLAMLQYNFQQLKVAVGNALIPIAQAVLPGINAIISALTKLAYVFANVTSMLFGKSTQIKTNTSVESSANKAANATDKLAESTANVGSAAKEAEKDMKGVQAGFDELDILAGKAASSMEDAAGGMDLGGIEGLEPSDGEIWGDAHINPDLSAEIYALTEKLKEMLPLIAGIGAGLLAWKIAKHLIPDLGLLQGLLGGLMVAAGITLLIDSIKDIIFGDGLTWENILKGAVGGALAGAGLGLLLAKKLGLTWAQGMLGGAVIGLGVALLIESIADIIVRGLNIGNGILGAIGGAIAGAAAGFLYMGGTGGAILGATIGVGIALVIESIADIAVSGLNLVNGAVGLIGGALAGAGIGFYLGGPMGAALGAIIGVGITLSLEGIVSQIAGGVDLAGALMTIIGTALAGAGIGFAIGGGFGALAGAVIGLVAGVVIEITGIKAAGEAAYAATEDFQVMTKILEECEDSANRSSFAMETLRGNIDNLTTSLADVGAAQQLVDEIYEINENANASAYELELMATKVDLLNSMGLEGLHLTIDETTGRIVETKEATDQLIKSLQKEAETAALQELLIQAYKDRYQAVADAERAVKNVDAAEQALAKTERELTKTPWWDLKKHSELTAQQEKQTKALEAATDARDKAVQAYDELSGAIDTYSGALTNLSEPESSVGVQLEERMNSVRETVQGVADDMPGYGRNIGEGLEQGMAEGISEEKEKSIWGKIGDWFRNFFGIHSPSTLFKEFGGDLMAGLHNGLSENLEPINTLFSDLWEDVRNLASDAWENVQKAWEDAGDWFDTNIIKPVGEFFEGLWDDISTWASDTWDDVQKAWNDAGNWFSKNVTEPLGKFFSEMWDNIQEKAGEIWGKIVDIWEQAGKWFEDNVTKPIGDAFEALGNFVKGVFNGIIGFVEGLINKAISAINWLIDQLNKISFDVPDWVPGIGGRNFGFNISRVQEVRLPRLANGAVIPPNQQFAAILGDQRSGKNLEAPAGLVRQMVMEGMQAAMAQGNWGNSGNQTIILEVDGREWGRATVKFGGAEYQRIGTKLVEARS